MNIKPEIVRMLNSIAKTKVDREDPLFLGTVPKLDPSVAYQKGLDDGNILMTRAILEAITEETSATMLVEEYLEVNQLNNIGGMESFCGGGRAFAAWFDKRIKR